MNPPPALALASLLSLPLLVGCGAGGSSSGDPTALTDSGYASLNSGNHDDALGSFQQALQGLAPGAPGFVRAAVGEIEALIHVDAKQAEEKFLQLAQSFPDSVGAREYKNIGGKLTSEKKYTEALAVLDVGSKAHVEDPDFDVMIATVKEKALEANDADAMKALKGLGYLGGQD